MVKTFIILGLIFSTHLSLAEAVLTQDSKKEIWFCGGSEPFWSLQIQDNRMTFTNPSTSKTTSLKVTEELGVYGFEEDFVRVVKGKGTRVRAVATLKKFDCQGVSDDFDYSHEIIFIHNSEVYYGCCNRK